MREPYSFILQPSIQIDDDMTIVVIDQGKAHGGRAVLIDVVDQAGRGFIHLALSVGAAQQLLSGLNELVDSRLV